MSHFISSKGGDLIRTLQELSSTSVDLSHSTLNCISLLIPPSPSTPSSTLWQPIIRLGEPSGMGMLKIPPLFKGILPSRSLWSWNRFTLLINPRPIRVQNIVLPTSDFFTSQQIVACKVAT